MSLRIQWVLATVAILAIVPLLVVQAQGVGATSTEMIIEEQSTTSEPVVEEAELVQEGNDETTGVAEALVADQSEPAQVETAEAEGVATSTPVIEEPKPVEERLVLQPGVDYSITGRAINATIELQNVTCRSCEKVLPDVDVKAYYTPWYPNDGEAHTGKAQSAAKTDRVPSLSNWDKTTTTYSASDIAPGRYYFVVEVDPNNEHDAYYLFRSEFSI